MPQRRAPERAWTSDRQGTQFGQKARLTDIPDCVVCETNASVSEARDGGRTVWKCGDCGYSWDR